MPYRSPSHASTPLRALPLLVLLALLLGGCGAAPPPPAAQWGSAASASATATVPPQVIATTAKAIPPTTPPPTAAIPVAAAATPAREAATVVAVVDGDTIKVRFADGHTDTVRYIGIDTPETKDPRTTVECFGEAASAKNSELVAGRAVALEKDVSERDRYGRLLRYVWVTGDGGEERFTNAELVQWGFAAATSYPPDVRYQERFRSLQQAAQGQKLGLWGACNSAHDPLPVAVPPSTTPPIVVPPQPTALPAIAPTGTPPVLRPTAPPVAPANTARLVASVSNASPTKNTVVTVTATLTDGGGQGLAGATMQTTWRYKTTTSSCAGGPSGASGTMTCGRSISQATAGYTVAIDVLVTYQGQTYRTTTSFTPR